MFVDRFSSRKDDYKFKEQFIIEAWPMYVIIGVDILRHCSSNVSCFKRQTRFIFTWKRRPVTASTPAWWARPGKNRTEDKTTTSREVINVGQSLKGHGYGSDFLGFLHKQVRNRSLTLCFESFRFWLLSRGDIRNEKTLPDSPS